MAFDGIANARKFIHCPDFIGKVFTFDLDVKTFAQFFGECINSHT